MRVFYLKQHASEQRGPPPPSSLHAPQTALHVGFIPLIIGVALVTTEPRPTLLQLLSPM